MAEVSGFGCLSILLLPFVFFFGAFSGAVAPAVMDTVEVITETSATAGVLTLIYTAEVPLSDEAWGDVRRAVEQRINVWAQANIADAGSAIETLFSVRVENGKLTILIYSDTITPEDIAPLLTRGGYLELVDLSGVPSDMLAGYDGREIMTSARIIREGINEGGMIVFPTVIGADGFVAANVTPDSFGGNAIEIVLNDASANALGEFTEANIGQPLAIVLDGIVLSVPIVQSRIESPILLTGNFSDTEAQILAIRLNSTPLDVELILQSVNFDFE